MGLWVATMHTNSKTCQGEGEKPKGQIISFCHPSKKPLKTKMGKPLMKAGKKGESGV